MISGNGIAMIKAILYPNESVDYISTEYLIDQFCLAYSFAKNTVTDRDVEIIYRTKVNHGINFVC